MVDVSNSKRVKKKSERPTGKKCVRERFLLTIPTYSSECIIASRESILYSIHHRRKREARWRRMMMVTKDYDERSTQKTYEEGG